MFEEKKGVGNGVPGMKMTNDHNQPIIQTNALSMDEDTFNKFVKSASSSESVNSQEGITVHNNNRNVEFNPPPPLPRNRHELLEQRHKELLDKQKSLKSQYAHLQQQIAEHNHGTYGN